MSTRRFVTIISVALIVFILVVGSVAIATAEKSTYQVDAVVVSYETTPWGDVLVEAVDEDGSLISWYEDIVPHIGDVFTLIVFSFGNEEEDEIIDAYCVDRLSTLEMVQWLCH